VPPWLILALLVALSIALLYQIASGRYGWRVLFYWGVILVGILGAEVVAESAGMNVTRFGDLRLAPDLSGALLMVLALRFIGA
jgi:hypothetical protein